MSAAAAATAAAAAVNAARLSAAPTGNPAHLVIAGIVLVVLVAIAMAAAVMLLPDRRRSARPAGRVPRPGSWPPAPPAEVMTPEQANSIRRGARLAGHPGERAAVQLGHQGPGRGQGAVDAAS